MKTMCVALLSVLAISGVTAQVRSQNEQAPKPQEQEPKPDISLAESKRISPFPPKDVQVDVVGRRAVVKWSKVPSDRITGYDIYRAIDAGPLQKLGHAKEPPFVDEKPPKGKLSYAVESVDYNDNRSKPRQASTEIK
jgi:hypothetical protein